MKAIQNLLPHENIIYFGDTARLPYGTKSRETILKYSIENASFLIQQGIKVLVIACHTACSHALRELQKQFETPIIGVSTSLIEHIRQVSATGQIAILGTRGTIASGAYQNAIKQLFPEAEITAIASQLLVNLVEEGFIDHPLTSMAIAEYLHPIKNKEMDALILGCTHFPLLSKQIEQFVGPDVQVVDPAYFCARDLQKLLKEKQLLNTDMTPPHLQFFVSDDPEKFRLLGQAFLGQALPEVSLIRGCLQSSIDFSRV